MNLGGDYERLIAMIGHAHVPYISDLSQGWVIVAKTRWVFDEWGKLIDVSVISDT